MSDTFTQHFTKESCYVGMEKDAAGHDAKERGHVLRFIGEEEGVPDDVPTGATIARVNADGVVIETAFRGTLP